MSDKETATHKAHCFLTVQPESEFMGCKYGPDKDCPVSTEKDMLMKWSNVYNYIVTITSFLEWYDQLDESKRYRTSHNDLLCEYFEIDQNKLEKQRRALLERHRSA